YHLDRGYERLVEKLRGVGARVARVGDGVTDREQFRRALDADLPAAWARRRPAPGNGSRGPSASASDAPAAPLRRLPLWVRMARIPREIVDTIRDRTDIVEVVQRHVHLQRRGASWVGLCP